MTTQTSTLSRLRLSGWLLIAPLVIFVGTIILGIFTQESILVDPDHATIAAAVAAVAPYRVSWAVSWLLSFAAIFSLAVGLINLAIVLAQTQTRYLALLGTIAAIGSVAVWAFLVYLNIGLIADVNHLPPFVADQSVSQIGALIGFPSEKFAGILWVLSATLMCAGLFLSGLLRRTGLIVGILNGLGLVLNLLGLGFPPIISLVFMVPVGIGLLRRKQV
jgi:hypothetical protein